MCLEKQFGKQRVTHSVTFVPGWATPWPWVSWLVWSSWAPSKHQDSVLGVPVAQAPSDLMISLSSP